MKRLVRSLWIAKYPYTNESVPAVMAGMDIKSTDKICAVCGSLDQAFAMLEYGAEVLAVDNKAQQAEFARYKAGLIRDGKFDEFFEIAYHPSYAVVRENPVKRRHAYFREPGRLERIRQNIRLLEIRLERSFIRGLEPGRFSKAYLSNILGYNGFRKSPASQKEYIQGIAERLKTPGLIYITNDHSAHVRRFTGIVECDEELTRKAKELEHMWQPAVYRVI